MRDHQSLSDLYKQAEQCHNRGDFRGAIARWEEVAAQARAQGDHGYELAALASLPVAWGNIADFEKEVEAATRLLARARELKREDYTMRAGLRLTEALVSLDLRGRWWELRPLLLEGLETAKRLGEHWCEVYHLKTLGQYAIMVGEEEQGYAWLQDALNAIRPDMGEFQLYFRAEIYAGFSLLMRKRGDYAEAIRYAEMAVGAWRDYGNPSFVVSGQLNLAQAEQARGELAEALRLVEEVLLQARQMGWRGTEQEAEYSRSELERVLGHADVAETAARRALELAREMKLKEEEVECLLSWGQALLALRRNEEAREILRQARRRSQEQDYEDHFSKAEELLAVLQAQSV